MHTESSSTKSWIISVADTMHSRCYTCPVVLILLHYFVGIIACRQKKCNKMMLARISGKNGNVYYPGGHGPPPSNIQPPVPKAITIKQIGDNQLQVNWTWVTSVLETMKAEAASGASVVPPRHRDERPRLSEKEPWKTTKAWTKELRMELLVRDEASEWNASWGPRMDIVACVIHNDGVDPFASGIQIQLPTTAELVAAATKGNEVKLKEGKVHVKVRLTGISQFGLVGRYRDSNGVDIAIGSEAAAESSCTVI